MLRVCGGADAARGETGECLVLASRAEGAQGEGWGEAPAAPYRGRLWFVRSWGTGLSRAPPARGRAKWGERRSPRPGDGWAEETCRLLAEAFARSVGQQASLDSLRTLGVDATT